MKIFIYGSVGVQDGSGESIKFLTREETKLKQKSFIFIQQAFTNYQGFAQCIITFYSDLALYHS